MVSRKRTHREELIGTVGVDAGQVIITDPGYLNEFRYDLNDYAEGRANNKKGNYSYSGSCESVLRRPKRAGQLSENGILAVVAESGYGDGEYPVYATYGNEGVITSLRVDFLGEEVPTTTSKSFIASSFIGWAALVTMIVASATMLYFLAHPNTTCPSSNNSTYDIFNICTPIESTNWVAVTIAASLWILGAVTLIVNMLQRKSKR